MREAMKQNPNMIRTLLILSFSLIFLLAYAVYGASNNSGYYLYMSSKTNTDANISTIGNTPIFENGKTVWIWEFETNTVNLTWVNVSVEGAYENSNLKVINVDGSFWSHPELGDINSEFNCADRVKRGDEHIWVVVDCQTGSSHSMILVDGSGLFISLTHPDPAIRDGGTVRADDYNSALNLSNEVFNNTHDSGLWQISIESEGNQTHLNPLISVNYVNEEIVNLELFKIDAATEMLWSMAALIGCFMILLVPAFMIYFISRQTDKKERIELELALENDK